MRKPDEGSELVRGARMGAVEMRCADCGCLIDRGEVVERCADPDCCCKDLPDKHAEVDSGNT